MSDDDKEQPAMRWEIATIKRWCEETMMLPASVLTKENFIDHTATEAAIMRRYSDMMLERMRKAIS